MLLWSQGLSTDIRKWLECHTLTRLSARHSACALGNRLGNKIQLSGDALIKAKGSPEHLFRLQSYSTLILKQDFLRLLESQPFPCLPDLERRG